MFLRGLLFNTYPFPLPNLVCAGILIFGIIIRILFLEETHNEKKHRKDVGLEYGSWRLGRLVRQDSVKVLGT